MSLYEAVYKNKTNKSYAVIFHELHRGPRNSSCSLGHAEPPYTMMMMMMMTAETRQRRRQFSFV